MRLDAIRLRRRYANAQTHNNSASKLDGTLRDRMIGAMEKIVMTKMTINLPLS
ncbi:hypothetical protein [Moorena sp. SIO4G3]|uniref:hypothetical protein n=1 Tax=Moorena sp. SIO4G3 TaxID=2607821 RepID=UPI00142B3F40|nr:hypothetical protein [Moorena sp. SIO4G3]NEO78515.1 hypothetical protein [Moorena sp. SIO4G3]